MGFRRQNFRLSEKLIFRASLLGILFFAYSPSLRAESNTSTQSSELEKMRTFVGSFFSGITTKQTKDNDLQKAANLNESIYDPKLIRAYSTAGFENSRDKSIEQNKILYEHLKKESMKNLGDAILASNPTLQKIQNGLKLDIDFSRSANNNSKNQKQTDTVKYGLVLKEIIPSETHLAQAAVGRMNADDLRVYASKVETIWTIEPIDYKDSAYINQVSTKNDEENNSLWSRIKLPEARFSSNIKPDFGGGNKPGMRLNLSQSQGLYEYSLDSGSTSSDQNFHQFRLPLVGSMNLSRKLNTKLESTQTSLNNILISENAPTVNLLYLDKEHRYGANAALTTRSGYSLGAKIDTPSNWHPTQDSIFNTQGERYEINLAKNF